MGRAQECVPGRLPLARFQGIQAVPQRFLTTTAACSGICEVAAGVGSTSPVFMNWHQGEMPLRTVSQMRCFEAA